MTPVHRVTVYAHNALAQSSRVFAASVALICLACLPSPVWAQWNPCPGGPTGSQCSTANVGIGSTTSPAYSLDVRNSTFANQFHISGDGTDDGGYLLGTANGGYFGGNAAFDGTNWIAKATAGSLVTATSGRVRFFTNSGLTAGTTYTPTERVRVDEFGNVGIGTTNPQSLLAVNGRITTKEVVVTNAGWSDYVFKPDYHLTPLNQVSAYIKEHHHLPEIPSEAEVKEKGVDLGDMQAKLLAKVEELTLHMIQAEERNRQLQERIAQLEARAGQHE